MGFSNAPPTSFGMPQPYSQTPHPIHNQPVHPTPNIPPTHTYPPQQMPYPSQSMPTSYPSNPYYNQPAPSSYPHQQNYNMYPNLQKAPDAKDYFNSTTPSPYPSQSNAYTASSNPYQGGNYPGGQRAGPTYPYASNSPTVAPRGATSAPHRFTPKVRI